MGRPIHEILRDDNVYKIYPVLFYLSCNKLQEVNNVYKIHSASCKKVINVCKIYSTSCKR